MLHPDSSPHVTPAAVENKHTLLPVGSLGVSNLRQGKIRLRDFVDQRHPTWGRRLEATGVYESVHVRPFSISKWEARSATVRVQRGLPNTSAMLHHVSTFKVQWSPSNYLELAQNPKPRTHESNRLLITHYMTGTTPQHWASVTHRVSRTHSRRKLLRWTQWPQYICILVPSRTPPMYRSMSLRACGTGPPPHMPTTRASQATM